MRLALRTRLRRRLRRLSRLPACSPIVPRPAPRGATERPFRLSHVLLACDLNPRYLGCWEPASRAWREVAGLEPVLVLVAERRDVPEALLADERVHVLKPLPGLATSFQAQCCRLLYPALLETDGAVLVSDVDMLPLSARYFHGPLDRIGERDFVAYRDALLQKEQLAICYNAGLPATWGEVFGVGTIDELRSRLAEWGDGVAHDGRHGGSGWWTDQELLYRTLVAWGRSSRRLWIIEDWYSRHRRLERADLVREGGLSSARRASIRRLRYSDYHCALPYEEFRDVNELVVDLAVAASRGRPASADAR